MLKDRVEDMWRVLDEYNEGRILEVDMGARRLNLGYGIRHAEADKGDGVDRLTDDELSDEDLDEDDFLEFIPAEDEDE